MDDIERGQRTAEQFNGDALAAHNRKRDAETPGRTHCLDCEEPIPEARRKAQPGCKRCRDCQEIYEHWRAL